MGCDVDVIEVVEEAVVGFFDVVVSGIVFSDAVDDDGEVVASDVVLTVVVTLSLKMHSPGRH